MVTEPEVLLSACSIGIALPERKTTTAAIATMGRVRKEGETNATTYVHLSFE